jgi:hypothetical protein
MTTAGDTVGGAADAGGGDSVWTSYHTRDRLLLLCGIVVSYAIFHFIGRAFRIPELRDFQASLLGNASPVLTLVVTLVTLIACVLVSSLIAGTVHFEAGLFCACAGMLALSTRGGPMRYVLMESPAPAVWVRLLSETVILFAFVGIGWFVLMQLRERNLLRGEPLREDDPDALPGQGVMALATQIVIMIFLVILLAEGDQKAQVVWAIAIASFLATLAAHSLFPARPSIWFWSAPFVVAAVGYVCAMVGGPVLPGGQVGGLMPALARPLPLDYAAVGPAAAMLGYWTSRRWQHEREDEPHTTGEVEEALEQPAT